VSAPLPSKRAVPSATAPNRRAFVIGVAARASVLALLWWVMTRGAPASWSIGAPAVALATATSMVFGSKVRTRWSPSGTVRFALFFVMESLRGGLDVARRAIAFPLTLDPIWVRYRVALPAGPARLLMCSCVSLLPGTLAVDFEGDDLLVHSLSRSPDPVRAIEALEARLRQALALGPESPRHG
jgi:multicomponent Na+:H+ antiporter subunit E